MTCAEFKELAGAYAIGALSPDEKAACDAHLASAEAHDGCWAALRAANEAAALVALSLPPVEPSPALWASIEGKLVGKAQVPRRKASTAWLPWLAVAALLVLVIFIGRDRTRLEEQLAASTSEARRATTERAKCVDDLSHVKYDLDMQKQALELVQRSGTKLVAMAPQGGSTQTATVIFAPDKHQAYVVGRGLAASDDKDFELWLIRGDQKIAAGLLKGKAFDGGSLLAEIDPKLLGTTPPDAFAVTLEPKGGGEQPRGTLVLVGKI